MARAIAKKAQTEMALSDERPDYMKDSNRGNEEVTMDDVTLPRIDVIQALSPQIKRNDPAYIEGAEQGGIFNTVTNKVYGSEVTIVPVHFRKEWLIWKKRTEGGGFRGAYSTEAEAKVALEAEEDSNSLEIIDTAQHFVLVMAEGKPEQAVISMSRSKMKPSRQLNSMVRISGGDRFSRAYKVSAVEDSSDKGDYWNFKITQLGYVDEAIFNMAEEMYESVTAGQKSVNYSDVEDEPSSGDSEY